MAVTDPPLHYRLFRCVVVLTLGSLTGCEWAKPAGSPPPEVRRDGSAKDGAVLMFAGDIMLDDRPGECIKHGGDPFQPFAGILKSADVTIGNLECVISTQGTPMAEKNWTFQPHPRVLPVLKRHFDAVSLANNHTGDFGHGAFVEQLDLLERSGIKHFGGGRNCMEARTPCLLQVKGIRIALLGFNDFHPRDFEAGPSWPGVAWCEDEQVLADIAAARAVHKADLVIPFMHWGEEQVPANARQKKLARRMIDAGADVVIGSHPHWTQGAEYYKGRLIVYSLGNFVFDGFREGPSRVGWLLRLRLDRKGLLNWDTVVAHTDENGIPHPERETASPAGDTRSGSIKSCRALVDSPFTVAGNAPSIMPGRH